MILLIRHLESTKNINKSFSSHNDNEEITQNGFEKGIELSDSIHQFMKKNGLRTSCVYCANSQRAILTAKLIANELNIGIKPFDELRSNKAGALEGKSEMEALNLNPLFMHQLKLFRTGIFSSYNFVKMDAREDKHHFENRVNKCVDSILCKRNDTLTIIVLHHSSITAAVIRFARELYSYPKDFYGHIDCELGHLFLIDSNNIILCNESPIKLLDI